MSLKIIGAGFGRTGTLSTKFALNKLGYPCYHMKEVIKKGNRHHLDFWLKVSETPKGTQHNWQEVFNEYVATVDFPGACVWEELIATYPEAKVILTLHPKGPEGWYKSTIETIYTNEKIWEIKLLAFIIPFVKKMKKMTSNLIWKRFLKNTMDDKVAAINRYNAHVAEVKSKVPADQLLIFSVDQGWKPLCDFLGVAIPKIDFPRANDKTVVKRRAKFMSRVVKFLLVLVMIMLIAFIWMLLNAI